MDLYKYIICLILVLATLTVKDARAQFLSGDIDGVLPEGTFIVNPGLFYRHDQKKRTDKSTVEMFYGDFSLGYQFPNNWYIGLMYSYEQERVVSDNFPVDGIDSRYEYTRTTAGVSGGYVYGSYYARVHYLFSADWQVDENNTSIAYTNGWGTQLDFGVNFELFSTFLIGPRLSYKYLVYTKQKGSQGTSSLNPNLVKTSLDPYFVVWWEF